LIASAVEPGVFLLESTSYIPEQQCRLPLHVVLALLNSKLCEWYFRLGSTNAMIGEYQFNNLPCPVFAEARSAADAGAHERVTSAIGAGRLDDGFEALQPFLIAPPFSKTVQEVPVTLVDQIMLAEGSRGSIARTDRATLGDGALPFQALIDRILYAMAGLTDDEAGALEVG